MLPKEDRDIISQIGRYQYNKMKKLNMTLKEYTEFKKETKSKIEQKKNEKNKVRYRTIRYIERYCDLQMKCRVCGKRAEIHHPNNKDYLKINLLCKERHVLLHNFELIPPKVIDLEQIKVKEQPKIEKQEYIKEKLQDIKKDVLSGYYNYSTLSEKYKISTGTIKRYLKKETDWNILEEKLKKASIVLDKKMKHKNNPIQKYRMENKMTIKEFSDITQIPMPTLRAIEFGKTDIRKISFKTRYKLNKVLEQN